MKKTIIFQVTVMLVCLGQLNAQTSPEWIVRYNGPASKFDGTRAMCIDNNNNIYVAGSSEGKKGNLDYVIVKYNSGGLPLDTIRYNGSGNGDDVPTSITTDANGSVYITGRSRGVSTGMDIVTVKYNADGSFAWSVPYQGNLDDNGNNVITDEFGNVYVTGFAKGEQGTFGYAIVTIKYNSSGVQEWADEHDVYANVSSGSLREEGISLDLDASNDVYVTGVSGSNMVTLKYSNTGSKLWVANGGSGNGREIIVTPDNNVVVSGFGGKTIKYDASGSVIWERTHASLTWAMTSDAAGNLFIAGTVRDPNVSDDYSVSKYSAAGDLLWTDRIISGTTTIDIPRAICTDNSGNVYVTGRMEIKSGKTTIVNFGTVKYSDAGTREWIKYHEGEGFAAAVDDDGNLYVSGQNATRQTYFDIVTLKYPSSIPTAAFLNTEPSPTIRNYPNPFSSTTVIEYSLLQPTHVRMSVNDISGKQLAVLVNEKKYTGVHRIEFSAANLPAGYYFYTIQTANSREVKKMVLIR